MDIHSTYPWPSSALSNFAKHPFELYVQGLIPYNQAFGSMEGFLQHLKVPLDHPDWRKIAALHGFSAKRAGSKWNDAWQKTQRLNLHEFVTFDRHSEFYQRLLRIAYKQMAMQNQAFCDALLATGSEELTHSVGHNDSLKTILTETEFVTILTELRTGLSSL